MRRPAPRPVHLALDAFRRGAAPVTLLARVQEAWPAVVGRAIAAEAEPVAERGGSLTVRCRSAAWAHELSLLGPDLVARLNAALEPSGPGPLREVRASTGGGADELPAPPRSPIP